MTSTAYLSPFLCVLSLLVPCMEVDISVPSFPQIAHFFSVSEGVVQLTIAYNFLGFFLGAFLYGPLSESHGRRAMMLLGNGILALGALGCFVAPSMDLLLLARFLQGIGASTSAVLIFVMISDVYQGTKAFRLIGLMNACLSSFMAIAPLVGGFINQAWGWRGNYGFVFIMSLVSWGILYFFLPETRKTRKKVDIASMAQDYGTLLKSAAFMSAALVPSLFFAAYMVFISASAFLYMETFGLSVLGFAMHQAVIVTSFAFPSLVADKLIQRWGGVRTVQFGTLLSLFGLSGALYLGLIRAEGPLGVTLALSVLCVGWALFYPVIFGGSLNVFPHIRGTASSMIMSTRAFLVFGLTSYLGSVYSGAFLPVMKVMMLGLLPGACLILFLLAQNTLPSLAHKTN